LPFWLTIAVTRSRSGSPVGRAVVEHIKGIAREPERFDEAIDDPRGIVDCVVELFVHRSLPIAETRQIGGDHVIAIGKPRDQITKHMASRRKAMEEQDDRRIGGTGKTPLAYLTDGLLYVM
jgi:hypothetical protein